MSPVLRALHKARLATSRAHGAAPANGRALARSILADEAGAVAINFGLMAIVMFLFMAAAVDYGRWLSARQHTITAIDAAVLAGGRALQLNSSNVEGAVAAAAGFYVENVRDRMPVLDDTISFAPTDDNTAFTASGNAYIATPLLSLANIPRLPLLDTAGSDFSKAILAVGGNAGVSLEISLMLDTSGSMRGSKLTALKEAASDLVNIVVWDDQSEYTSKMAIAPFSGDVGMPAAIRDAARGTGHPNTKSSGRTTYYRTECMAERIGANAYTDAAPGPGNYVLPVYTTSSTGKCSQPVEDVGMGLSSNKSAITAKINGLKIGGGTAGHLGTAWAWYMLSPNWSNVFTGASAPAAYGTADLQKIAILMTDGEFNAQFKSLSGAGISASAGDANNGGSSVQAKALCDGMKAQGITVYTIGFDLGGNQTAINTLNYCATSAGHAYNAADAAELRQAFRDIALKISALYLSN